MMPRPPQPATASLLIGVGVGLLVLDVGGGLIALVWALFFSVGARGGSTEDLVRYNLSDPVTSIIAYGPLLAAAMVGFAGVVCLVTGIRRRPTAR